MCAQRERRGRRPDEVRSKRNGGSNEPRDEQAVTNPTSERSDGNVISPPVHTNGRRRILSRGIGTCPQSDRVRIRAASSSLFEHGRCHTRERPEVENCEPGDWDGRRHNDESHEEAPHVAGKAGPQRLGPVGAGTRRGKHAFDGHFNAPAS
ncbi:hypothetical protein F01_570075 [Burkholderia cenocepacia]|nr:hypothetical protein F01_570075 [Burkholderia cenocepacia]